MAGANPRLLTTACDLELMEVRSPGGVRLGRVFDVRCRQAPGEPVAIDAIVYGRRGLLERLGLRKAPTSFVRWSKVLSIEDRVIVVEREPPRRGKTR